MMNGLPDKRMTELLKMADPWPECSQAVFDQTVTCNVDTLARFFGSCPKIHDNTNQWYTPPICDCRLESRVIRENTPRNGHISRLDVEGKNLGWWWLHK